MDAFNSFQGDSVIKFILLFEVIKYFKMVMERITRGQINTRYNELNKPYSSYKDHLVWRKMMKCQLQNSGKREDIMLGVYDKLAEKYLDGRPTYPAEWYKMLADLTPHHSLAWDVATGNGQAALGVAEHYEQVIATDISEPQLKYAMQHPRIRYLHTPLSLSDDELANLIGTEGSVDLITVAQAIHWFDLPRFYSVVTRLLRKPGGILAVWGYNDIVVSPIFDAAGKRWFEATLPYWNSKTESFFGGYRSLPFPFESVGLGSEGNPLALDIPKELSFDGYLRMMRSWSVIETAKEKGVDLLSEGAVKELEAAWGGANLVRSVVYKGFMLVGKV